MRREFHLPEEDVKDLNARRLQWEAVKNDQGLWVLVHDFPLPEGYNHRTATAAVRIETGYPDAPLDMIYFSPASHGRTEVR